MPEGDPRNIKASGSGGTQALVEQAYQEGQRSGYYNAQGQPLGPTGFTAQMMDKLFHCRLPDTKEEYDDFYSMISTVLAALPRIPNISEKEYTHQVRVWHDINEMSASEGVARIVASDIRQTLFELRLLVARGDVPLPGITGVSAIITTRQHQEQIVKMPQQSPEAAKGFLGFFRGRG